MTNTLKSFGVILLILSGISLNTSKIFAAKLSLSYSSLYNCEGERFINENKYNQLYRGECFEKLGVYYYQICGSPADCGEDILDIGEGEILGEVNKNPYETFLSSNIIKKFKPYIEKFKEMSLSELEEVKKRLKSLQSKHADQPILMTITNYLLYEVDNLIGVKKLLNTLCEDGGEC